MLREATRRSALLRLRRSVYIPLVLLVRDRRIGQAPVSRLYVINPEALVLLSRLTGLIQLFRRAAGKCCGPKREQPDDGCPLHLYSSLASGKLRFDSGTTNEPQYRKGGQRESIQGAFIYGAMENVDKR